MKYVNFARKYEFKFPGKVKENALVLGDVDSDGTNELVVGNMNGLLAVFKRQYLWQTIGGHEGGIACVAVGNVMNRGNSNNLVVIGNTGIVKVYLCLQDGNVEKLRAVHTQRLPANARAVVLDEVQCECNIDMAVGFSDGTIRFYRWLQTPMDNQFVCTMVCEVFEEFGNITTYKMKLTLPVLDGDPENREPRDCLCCAVPQSGPRFISMAVYGVIRQLYEMTAIYEITDDLPEDDSSTLCRVLCDIGRGNSVALSHIEGIIYFVSEHCDLLWVHRIPDSPFALRKMAMNRWGTECLLVVGCWSGHTYFMDYRGDIACFKFNRDIQAFTAGTYSTLGNALVYSTISERIVIFYYVDIAELTISNFYDAQMKLTRYGQYSRRQMAELTRYCMYYLQTPRFGRFSPDDPFDVESFTPDPGTTPRTISTIFPPRSETSVSDPSLSRRLE